MNAFLMRARRLPEWLASSLVATAILFAAAPALCAPTAHECAVANEDSLALRKQDKLTQAKERLLVCTDAACPAEIRDACSHDLSSVADAIPSVVFEVKDASGNDVSAVRVTMDSALLVDRAGAAAVTIDPGEHVFRFEAGSQSVEKTFVVREGEKNRHLSVTLGGAPKGAGSSFGARKALALVAGGVGVVGIGVGAAFGATAISSWNQAKSECGAGCTATSPAQSEKSNASSQGTISTVAFVAGGVLAAGAVVLWFTAPSGASVQVGSTPLPGGGQMTIGGTF